MIRSELGEWRERGNSMDTEHGGKEVMIRGETKGIMIVIGMERKWKGLFFVPKDTVFLFLTTRLLF